MTVTDVFHETHPAEDKTSTVTARGSTVLSGQVVSFNTALSTRVIENGDCVLADYYFLVPAELCPVTCIHSNLSLVLIIGKP
jgi:hypothetical protein